MRRISCEVTTGSRCRGYLGSFIRGVLIVATLGSPVGGLVLGLTGCGGTPKTEEVEQLSLYPTKDTWKWPKGLPFDKEVIQPKVASAFFYGSEYSCDIELMAYVEIPYTFENVGRICKVLYAVAIVRLPNEDPACHRNYLVLFEVDRVLTKLKETYLGSGLGHYVVLRQQECQGEPGPLVYLSYESGGNSKFLYHILYQVPRSDMHVSRLRKVWEHSGDADGRSTSQYYRFSNMKFHGFDGKGKKRIVAYSTSGIRRPGVVDLPVAPPPEYEKTIYNWDPIRQRFVKE